MARSFRQLHCDGRGMGVVGVVQNEKGKTGGKKQCEKMHACENAAEKVRENAT